jgi:hypothetical protein
MDAERFCYEPDDVIPDVKELVSSILPILTLKPQG